MTLRIHYPPAGDWHLSEHITEPRPSCIGLPRQYAPPEPDAEPERTRYRGVKRRVMADRVKYEANIRHNGRSRYIGVADSAVEAARLYDDYVRAWGLDKPLNFPESEGAA